MPINAYTGLMGSGKSFECVRAVIVPAIRDGRRVVTNVDGIDSDAIRAYCVEKFNKQLDELGQVVHCTNDDVFKPDFLPHGTESQTLCQPGDLICVDEAWRFWGVGCTLLEQHKIFFREHRHYVNPETKVSCDLVLMVQDIGDLHRTLKVVVELSFRTTKLKNLGLTRAYRVEMWEGYKQTARSRAGVEVKKYDPKIFPLYSSYSGGKGKEMQVDGRQNQITKGKIAIALLLIPVLGTGLYYSFRYFTPEGHGYASKSKPQQPGQVQSSASPVGQSSTTPATATEPQQDARIAGTLVIDGKQYVLIQQADYLLFEHPSNFVNSQSLYTMSGTFDGQHLRGVK